MDDAGFTELRVSITKKVDEAICGGGRARLEYLAALLDGQKRKVVECLDELLDTKL